MDQYGPLQLRLVMKSARSGLERASGPRINGSKLRSPLAQKRIRSVHFVYTVSEVTSWDQRRMISLISVLVKLSPPLLALIVFNTPETLCKVLSRTKVLRQQPLYSQNGYFRRVESQPPVVSFFCQRRKIIFQRCSE
jgi:hypothetical protein